MIRRLGGKRWQALHRLIYVSAIAGVAALLVAGESRRQPAADLRARRRHAARIPRLVGVPQARGRRAAPVRRRA